MGTAVERQVMLTPMRAAIAVRVLEISLIGSRRCRCRVGIGAGV